MNRKSLIYVFIMFMWGFMWKLGLRLHIYNKVPQFSKMTLIMGMVWWAGNVYDTSVIISNDSSTIKWTRKLKRRFNTVWYNLIHLYEWILDSENLYKE